MTHPFPPDDEDTRDGFDKAMDRLSEGFNKIGQNIKSGVKNDEEDFFKAVRSKKIKAIKDYLAAGFNPNTHNAAGDTALHIAARSNLTEIATLLLEAGANPRLGKRGEPDCLPLDESISFGRHEMVTLLTQHGGYVSAQGPDGWTPLHRAAEKGKTGLIRALLEAGANANETTGNGATPLLISIQRMQEEAALCLLDDAAAIEGMNVLCAKTDEKSRTAFHLAVERGETAVVEKMLNKGVFINKQDAEGSAPLISAIRRCSPPLVRMLIENGADFQTPAVVGPNPLLFVCRLRAPDKNPELLEIVRILLRAGADPAACDPATGLAPLHAAAAADAPADLLPLLLRHSPSCDIEDADGETPLFHAIRAKNSPAIKLLLEAGADPNTRSLVDAATPLTRAAELDLAPEIIRLLLEAGADPRAFDSKRKSALSYARLHKNSAQSVLFLEKALVRAQKKPAGGTWRL